MNSCFLVHERTISDATFLFPNTKEPNGTRFPLATKHDGLLQLKGKSHDDIVEILKKVAEHLPTLFDGRNYVFDFDESVSHNGWWLTCVDGSGNKHQCRITLWDEDGTFIG